jgi:outer membrane protein
MRKQVCALTLLLCFGVGPSLLWGQSPSAGAASGKIGVINIQQAILSTSEGKKAMAELQKKFQPRQQELQRLDQEIQSLRDQLQKGAATLSDDEQRRLSRELEDKQKLFNRSSDDFKSDAGSDRDEAVRRIGEKMVRLIGDYAQQNGYSLIVDDAQIPVYYASKEIDLTEEMVKRYDNAYPAEVPANSGTGAALTPPGTSPVNPATKPPVVIKPGGDKPKR